MSGLRVVGATRPADRPGPGDLPEALLRRVDLTIRRRIDGMLVGDHRASMFGDGTELAQVGRTSSATTSA